MKELKLLLFVFMSNLALSQVNIDSLIELYPNQELEDKAKTLSELCYQLSFSDLKLSEKYGRLGYEAALKTNNQNLISRTLSDWSIPHLSLGNFDTVLILNQRVLEIEMPEGDSVQVGASLNKMGLAAFRLGHYGQSLSYNLRALEIFKANNIQVYVGQTLSSIGNIHDANKMYDVAIDYYKEAEQIAEELGDMNGYATALNNQGHSLQNLKQYKSAEVKLKAANEQIQKLQNPQKLGLSYQTLGLNALYDNRPAEGRAYYKKALDNFRQIGYAEGLCAININIAECFLSEYNSDSAELYINEAQEIANETQSFFQQQLVYKAMVRLETLKGNYEKVDDYFNRYIAINDSIYNIETNQAIADMKVKYDTDQKTKALENEKLKSRNSQLWLLMAVVIIVLLVIIVLFLNYRRKLQAEKLKVEGYESLEKERTRIARDLHDNLGAELSLISSKIEIEMFKSNNAVFQENLGTISEVSKNANHQLRETIWSIHKSNLTVKELKEKIESFAERVVDDNPIDIAVTSSESDYMYTPAVALNLFRMAQEAINNSLKYAEASQLMVNIKPDQLTIVDNGKGFDIEVVRRGYGLNNIDQRTKDINGKLELLSGKEGTTVRISL